MPEEDQENKKRKNYCTKTRRQTHTLKQEKNIIMTSSSNIYRMFFLRYSLIFFVFVYLLPSYLKHLIEYWIFILNTFFFFFFLNPLPVWSSALSQCLAGSWTPIQLGKLNVLISRLMSVNNSDEVTVVKYCPRGPEGKQIRAESPEAKCPTLLN